MSRKIKKMLSVICVMCLLCSFSSATQVFADTALPGIIEENVNLTAYEPALNEYFSAREELYTVGSTSFDAGRLETIQQWKDRLEITIQSTDVTFSVNEVISVTLSEAKVRVYEWVWINYNCNGYEKVEEMGYGVDHIIRLRSIGGSYQVISDSYYDIALDCEYGTQEDLAIFESEREAFETASANSAVSMTASQMSTQSTVATDSYNAQAAIAYANQWFGGANTGYSTAGYNPKYSHYGSSDCCNFVSQCLAAGGLTMSGLWSAQVFNDRTTPVQDTAYAHSNEAWRYVPTFKTYWEGRGYTAIPITSTSQAIPGNPIFWLAADGNANNHNMLIVGKNSAGKIQYSCHSWNAYGLVIEDLSATTYYTIDFVHNFGGYTSQGSSGHARSCTLCGATVITNHDLQWKEVLPAAIYHAQYCTVCDFVSEHEDHDNEGEMVCVEEFHIYTCSKCGAEVEDEMHNFTYGWCDICGYRQ